MKNRQRDQVGAGGRLFALTKRGPERLAVRVGQPVDVLEGGAKELMQPGEGQASFGLVNQDRNNPRDIQVGAKLTF